MTQGYVLLALSVASLIAGTVSAVFSRRNKLWFFAVFTLASVVLLQLSLNVAYPYDFDTGEPVSKAEIITRVISSSFQSFSLDAQYTQIIRTGGLAFSGWGVYVFYVMACAMTFIAPATGGFAIFGILLHFFPYLKLYVTGFRATKFIFSELNEYTIETAESIFRKKRELNRDLTARGLYGREEYLRLKSSVIIFTDAYIDSDDEASSELYRRAKNIGAVCIKSDVLSLPLNWFLRRDRLAVYFLTDRENSEENMTSALSLLTENSGLWKRLGKDGKNRLFKTEEARFYVLSQCALESGIAEKTLKRLKDGGGYDKVSLKVINEYSGIVYKLLDKTPFYRALEKGAKKLDIAVLGGGLVAREFVKSAYWCGQLLAGAERVNGAYVPVKLKITVLTLDAERVKKQITDCMPEAFDERYGNYCTFDFKECEYGSSDFDGAIKKYCPSADYVLVALGNDEKNVRASTAFKLVLDRLNFGDGKRVPINFIIENDNLCKALKAQYSADSAGCTLNPFGSLRQRYDYDNICLSALENRCLSMDRVHGGQVSREEFVSDSYNLNSSIASVLHLPYKLFSVGADSLDGLASEEFVEPLYYLEHRRWCAYIRARGFVCPTAEEFKRYAFAEGKPISHKSLELKYHACLLECAPDLTDLDTLEASLQGGLEDIKDRALNEPAEGSLDDWLAHIVRFKDKNSFDGLDRLSLLVTAFGKRTDFKRYDVKVFENLKSDLLRERVYTMFASGCLRDMCGETGLLRSVADGKGSVYIGFWEGYILTVTDDPECARSKKYGMRYFADASKFDFRKKDDFAVNLTGGYFICGHKKQK